MTSTTLKLHLLFNDYVAQCAQVKPVCSDDPEVEPDSMWFHFTPGMSTCKSAMQAEFSAIAKAGKGLDPSTTVSKLESERHYIAVSASLKSVADPPVKYPEYDKIWGFGTDRKKVIVYAFFGVDSDNKSPDDVSAVEYFRWMRAVLTKFPKLQVVDTKPGIMLLDFWVNGKKLAPSYQSVFDWIVDKKNFPAGTTPAQQADLRKQAAQHWAERTVVWQMPVKVSKGTESREMTVEVRAFWGYEDGKWEYKQAAVWRYLEAFWYGDVFMYQGHSHFGHGPLEPTSFKPGNFPNRYQTFLVNSCVSFNYYDQDFLDMHPGGSKNADVVVNGLPAYWTNMGEASANYVIGLLDGTNKSWKDILATMIVKPRWQPAGYDPLRVVNGELDNAFDAKKTPVKLVAK